MSDWERELAEARAAEQRVRERLGDVYRMPGTVEVYEEPAAPKGVTVDAFDASALVKCPECAHDVWGPSREYGPKLCDGAGWLGLSKRGCPKGIRHFHMRCRCGMRWIMASKSEEPGDYEAQR